MDKPEKLGIVFDFGEAHKKGHLKTKATFKIKQICFM